MAGDYTWYKRFYSDKTVDSDLLAADTSKDNVVAVKSANHQLFIQKININIGTAAAQSVTFKDDAGTPIVLGVLPASATGQLTFDFGPKGKALTAGKNLDIATSGAGVAAAIHIEAYERPVNAGIHSLAGASAQ